MSTTVKFSVAIIRCADCGRRGLSLDDASGCGTRITHHKCSGAWDTEISIPLMKAEWSNLIEEAQHIEATL